mmetsp:Transcript_35389/g.83887  ORF Transcript_35389/g.83887 Transcript_35389/m.83887 type:complete len:138 (+) Transcript_35389:549-962(+)
MFQPAETPAARTAADSVTAGTRTQNLRSLSLDSALAWPLYSSRGEGGGGDASACQRASAQDPLTAINPRQPPQPRLHRLSTVDRRASLEERSVDRRASLEERSGGMGGMAPPGPRSFASEHRSVPPRPADSYPLLFS